MTTFAEAWKLVLDWNECAFYCVQHSNFHGGCWLLHNPKAVIAA